jgi:long-subunit fatty acid transport protein
MLYHGLAMGVSPWNPETKRSAAMRAFCFTHIPKLPSLTNLGPGFKLISRLVGGTRVNIPQIKPQQGMVSALYELFPNFNLMSNVDWQNWSAYKQFPGRDFGGHQRTIKANLHFSDTYQLAIGQQYRLSQKWLWSAGF